MSTLLKMQKIHPLCSRCIRMYPLQNRWTVLRYLQCYENFSECCTHLILPETALFSPTPTFAKEPVLIQMISLESLENDMNDKITKYSNTQNKIENKDFVALDPNQKRLQQDFAMEGIEYYYKSGYTISDERKCCSIDDVAIAVGCGLNNISLVGTIKGNYGKIFEKIDKPPYTDIFCNKHSIYFIWNNILIYRKFEIINANYQKNNSKSNKLISVHGNRFLLHIFLNIFSNKYNLKAAFLTDSEINQITEEIKQNLPKVVDQLVLIKNTDFPDSYLANIFKNGKRCESLFYKLSETDIYKSIQEIGVLV